MNEIWNESARVVKIIFEYLFISEYVFRRAPNFKYWYISRTDIRTHEGSTKSCPHKYIFMHVCVFIHTYAYM